jgi:hypothetical protein
MDIEQSCRWLKYGDIKGETESTIVAAQDQAISTNYFKNRILKEEIESKWSHWNSNKKLKEKSGIYTGKTFDRFTAADSCTVNITHNPESIAG